MCVLGLIYVYIYRDLFILSNFAYYSDKPPMLLK